MQKGEGVGVGAAFEEVLGLLACPACHGELRVAAEGLGCGGCGRVYPVVDGIPVLLVDRATVPEG